MKHIIGELPLPETEDQLISLIKIVFEQLTGAPLSSCDDIFIERYSDGGMSSGYVCSKFWREKAVPLFRARYSKT
jgi:hypothetical protein